MFRHGSETRLSRRDLVRLAGIASVATAGSAVGAELVGSRQVAALWIEEGTTFVTFDARPLVSAPAGFVPEIVFAVGSDGRLIVARCIEDLNDVIGVEDVNW